MKAKKGIILAGGRGTRLNPITLGVSKQLLPIYDKPMIYYPLSVLMLAGIRDILIITTPQDQPAYVRLLGDGSQWGIELSFKLQSTPDGLAQAFILAEDFLQGEPCTLILGDNIFYGHGFVDLLSHAHSSKGASVFAYQVIDPHHYGVVEFDDDFSVKSIEEKPHKPKSNYAITGLYFVDGTAAEKARSITPSERGELEITCLLDQYLMENTLKVKLLGRGYAWLDTGTQNSMLDASNFIRGLTERQGLLVGSPDEVSFRLGWISETDLRYRINEMKNSSYGLFLEKLLT